MEKKKKVVLDHYKVLGLRSGQEGAKLNETEITKALLLHPDKRPNHPNAKADFQRLNSSYEILRDPNARKKFDSSLRLNNKPSEPPSRDEGNDQVHLFLVGLLIFVLVPMIFPNARSGSNTLERLGSYIDGFFNLSKRSGLWSEMVRTSGRYFKRSPPPQATTNQESQVEDHENNKESQVDDHEVIEVADGFEPLFAMYVLHELLESTEQRNLFWQWIDQYCSIPQIYRRQGSTSFSVSKLSPGMFSFVLIVKLNSNIM